MSRQRFTLTLLLFVLAAAPAFAGGNGSGTWWDSYWTIWHRNNCWPEPFIYPDRASVWNMVDAQVSKGWQMQSLLLDAHFSPDGSKLSRAGMMKLSWILTQNPAQYRSVFVERSLNDEITAKRLAAAQQATAEMLRGGPGPDVFVSDLRFVGAPATYVNTINGKFEQSTPDPRLPAAERFDISNSQ